ncbi:chromate transporter [Starkeya sp. ORNL1]|nr:chromate transporter [Starkeya sp. ORNL1]
MLPGPLNRPSALQLFLAFTRITLTSFGGGLSGWLLREIVQNRKWVTEEEFLNGLSLSQALPGFNVTNLAIFLGYRLRGVWGAVAAVAGMVVPASMLVLVIAVGFASLADMPVTHSALEGAGAAAIGLSLAMGVTAAERVDRRAAPLAIMAATFVAVGILQWPLIWVLLGAGAVSVALSYARGV